MRSMLCWWLKWSCHDIGHDIHHDIHDNIRTDIFPEIKTKQITTTCCELAISHHLKELNLKIGISMRKIIYILIFAAICIG
jgi:hypothetical protein